MTIEIVGELLNVCSLLNKSQLIPSLRASYHRLNLHHTHI